MKGKIFKIILITSVVILLISCGPSEEAIATMTAAAWTPTPLPTPTPTPMPYSVSIKVVDAKGAALQGAKLHFEALGENEDAIQTSDETGMASWMNLPDDFVFIRLTAPGYFSAEITETIERGLNEITASLERDPFGLLAADACRPEETLLYIEDFQDKSASEWRELERHPQIYSFEQDEEGNFVLAVRDNEWKIEYLEGYEFTNFVWRLKFKAAEGLKGGLAFHWGDSEGQWYQQEFQYDRSNNNPLVRFGIGEPFEGAHKRSAPLEVDVWHRVEISFFNGLNRVWVDGEEFHSYADPDPLAFGKIAMNIFPREGSLIILDDFSICELGAPFETIITPEAD